MKPLLLKAINEMLLERFGEPIGSAPATPGVPDESVSACNRCGMMEIDVDKAHSCEMDESDDEDDLITCKCGGERITHLPDGHVKCEDCGRVWMDFDD